MLKVGKQITPGPKELNPKLAAKDAGNHSNLYHKISQKFEEFVALGPSGSEREEVAEIRMSPFFHQKYNCV